jgi:hypothetical protein
MILFHRGHLIVNSSIVGSMSSAIRAFCCSSRASVPCAPIKCSRISAHAHTYTQSLKGQLRIQKKHVLANIMSFALLKCKISMSPASIRLLRCVLFGFHE